MTDKERLDWLENQHGAGLISDDNGRWAVLYDGIQNCVSGKKASDVSTSFFGAKKVWKTSTRRAIDYAMKVDRG